jgi:hypothetical protein
VGQRRERRLERRLERSRQWRVYTLVGLAVVGIVAYMGFAAVTLFSLQDREAGAEATAKVAAKSPAVRKARLTAQLTGSFMKPAPTKRPRSAFPNPPEGSGEGRRIVYCNSCQRVWLVEDDEYVFWSYLVSGRRNYPRPGTYKVIRKINPGMSHELRLPYFVGFTYGTTTDVGFHGIPVRPNGTLIQSESQLGSPRSAGCVRQSLAAARLLWDFAPMGTKVVVLP